MRGPEKVYRFVQTTIPDTRGPVSPQPLKGGRPLNAYATTTRIYPSRRAPSVFLRVLEYCETEEEKVALTI